LKEYTENDLSSLIKKLNETLAEASQLEMENHEDLANNGYDVLLENL
jgi:hypothetical protein